MMNEIYFWIGLVVTNAVLLCLWLLTAYFGKEVLFRLARVYRLEVIWYWLNRLEKEGTHVFEKASKEAAK
jgi:hypothetical protein